MTRTTKARDRFIDGAIYALLDCDTGSCDEADVESDHYRDRVYAAHWQTPAKHWERDALTPAALTQLTAECSDFFAANLRDLLAYARYTSNADDFAAYYSAGIDFHLTRNHHGAGFWDRGLGVVGDRLTANAHPYGEINGWITDDNLVGVE